MQNTKKNFEIVCVQRIFPFDRIPKAEELSDEGQMSIGDADEYGLLDFMSDATAD